MTAVQALPRHPWWLLLRAGLRPDPTPGPLPTAGSVWVGHALRAAHVARYRRALGFEGDGIPLSYHYLALQRAQLAWMLRPDFPHRLLGMVHVAQTLETRAPWQPGLGFELHLQAALEGKRQVLLSAELRQDGHAVLGATSLYRPPRDPQARPLRDRAPEPPPPGTPLGRWTLPAHAGRAYARLSGDANPIHLWRWSARRFGLLHPIIHGMHTVARAEALLQAQGRQPLTHLSVQFWRPLALPGEAALFAHDGRFDVYGPAGRCASGRYA